MIKAGSLGIKVLIETVKRTLGLVSMGAHKSVQKNSSKDRYRGYSLESEDKMEKRRGEGERGQDGLTVVNVVTTSRSLQHFRSSSQLG